MMISQNSLAVIFARQRISLPQASTKYFIAAGIS